MKISKKKLSLYISFILLYGVLGKSMVWAQCDVIREGNVYRGEITLTTSWQTMDHITGGDYMTFEAIAGTPYLFSFCQGGGATTKTGNELSINDASGFYEGVGFNNLGCGGNGELYWVAETSGTYQLLITQNGCKSYIRDETLAWIIPDIPTGGHCLDPIEINTSNYSQNSVSTCDMGNFYHKIHKWNTFYTDGKEVVFAFTPPFTDCYFISTIASSDFSSMFLTDICPGDSDVEILWQVAFTNSDPMMAPTLTAGTTYYITIDINPYQSGHYCDVFDVLIEPCQRDMDVDNDGSNGDPEYLIENVFLSSGCTNVSNVRYTGNEDAVAYFSNADLGISEGIMLSTGNVHDAVGPNALINETSAWLERGDPDLGALIPDYSTNDAAVLEFEFVALKENLTFNYIFASEEYLEWVNRQFNDIFGFFLSGPGIDGTKNIAVIPGTSTPVSINTVNNVQNETYYINNPMGQSSTQFDGYTTLLTAEATGLIPCNTYRIKLAIADGGDFRLDSAVFLEANSFEVGDGVLISASSPLTSTQDVYEGCDNSYFLFERDPNADWSNPLTISFSVMGTATPNIDYVALPSSVTIPANTASVNLPVEILRDGFLEGPESIIISITDRECACEAPAVAILTILDHPLTDLPISEAQTTCVGEPITIGDIFPPSPLAPYTFEWSHDASITISNATVSPTTTTTYTLTITDQCGSEFIKSYGVSIMDTYDPIDPTITEVGSICEDIAPFDLHAAHGGGTWSGTGVDPVSGLFDPSIPLGVGENPVNITYTISNACGSDFDDISITLLPIAMPTIDPVGTLCGNDGIFALTADIAGGNWSGLGIVGGNNTTGDFDPSIVTNTGLESTSITYEVPNSCSEITSIEIPVNFVPTATLSGGETICSGESTQIAFYFTGEAPWQLVYAIDGSNQPPISVSESVYELETNQAGTYTITSISDVNCSGAVSSTSAEVAIASPTNGNISGGGAVCRGDEFFVDISLNGEAPWVVAVSNGVDTIQKTTFSSSFQLEVDELGTYEILLVRDKNGCEGTFNGSATLELNPIYITNIDYVNATCGLNNGSANGIIIEGGAAPLDISWLDNYSRTISTDPNEITDLEPGDYALQVIDANGCIDIRSFEIVAAEGTTIVDATHTNSDCENVNGSLTSISFNNPLLPIIYEWTDINGDIISTDPDLTNQASGNYTLHITDANLCTDEFTFTIDQNIKPEPHGGSISHPYCGGTNGNVTGIGINSIDPPLTYEWRDADGVVIANTLDLIDVGAGIYSFTVINENACQAGLTFGLVMDNGPSINGGLVTAATCGNSDGRVQGIGVSAIAQPVTYEWTDEDGNIVGDAINLTNVAAGIYHLTVKDNNLCATTSEPFIIGDENHLAIIDATIIPARCAVNNGGIEAVNIENSIGSITYEWYDADNVLLGTTATIENLAIGTYELVINDGNNCSTSEFFTVDKVDPPTLSGGDISPAICDDGLGTINNIILENGEAPFAYTWTDLLNNDVVGTNFLLGDVPAGHYQLSIIDANQCFDKLDWVVEQVNSPTITNATIKATSCGLADGEIEAVIIENGTAPYTYSWADQAGNDLGDADSLSNLMGGFYFLTITDANTCTASTNYEVTAKSAPTASIGTIINANCGQATGSITGISIANGNPPYTYTWIDENNNTIATTLDLVNRPKGDYFLIINDQENCEAYQSYTIDGTSIPSIESAFMTTAKCGKTDGSLENVSIIDGQIPFEYEWTDLSTNIVVSSTADLTNVGAGDYQLKIRDINNCQASKTFTINSENGPKITGGTSTTAHCGAASGSISGITVAEGQTPYTFEWTNNDGDIVSNDLLLENLLPDTYTLVVKDAQECIATTSFTIMGSDRPNIVAASIQAASCNEDNGSISQVNINGGTTPYTYEWEMLETGDLLGDEAQLSGLGEGNYLLSIRDANDCIVTKEFTLTAITPLSLTEGQIQDDYCASTSGSISGVEVNGGIPPYQYQWYDQFGALVSSDLSIDQQTAGTYQLIITDSDDCSVERFFEIAAQSKPTISEGLITHTTCGDNNGQITNVNISGGLAPFIYEWYDEQGRLIGEEEQLQNIRAGTYELNITDVNGCQANQDFELNDAPSALIKSGTITDATCGLLNGSITAIIIDNPDQVNLIFFWENDQGEIISDAEELLDIDEGRYTLYIEDENGCQDSYLFKVNSSDGLSITGGNIQAASCQTDNGSIVGVIVDAPSSNNYEVQWLNERDEVVATTIDLNNVASGSYRLQITDANGCTILASFSIPNINAPEIIDGTVVATSCGSANGSINNIQLSVEADQVQWEWLDEAQTVISTATSLDDLNAGAYILKITDANGCSSLQTFTIEASKAVDFLPPIIEKPSCGLANGSITFGELIGGTPPFEYQFLDDNGALINSTTSMENLSAGTYTLLVIDAEQCSITETIQLSNAAALALTTAPIITSADCGQASGSIRDIDINGGSPPFQFEWFDELANTTTPLANTQELGDLPAGTYRLVITDANQCTFSESFTVPGSNNAPQLLGSNVKEPKCGLADGSIRVVIDGGSSPYEYTWTDDAGNVLGATATIEDLATGTYYLMAKDQQDCLVERTFTIEATAAPSIQDAKITQSSCLSNDGSITEISITGGNPPYAYEWTDENGAFIGLDSTLVDVPAGVYQVKINDQENCSSIQSFTIDAAQAPNIQTADLTMPTCAAANGQIINVIIENGAEPYNYEWLDASDSILSNQETLENLSTGSYTLNIADANACTATKTFELATADLPQITDGTIQKPNCGESDGAITNIQIEGGSPPYTFEWVDENQQVIANLETLFGLLSGIYTLHISDQNNCTAQKAFEIFATDAPVINSEKINHPACGNLGSITELNVVGGLPPYIYTWMDRDGNMVSTTANAEDLSAGSYTLEINDQNNCATRKIFDLKEPIPLQIIGGTTSIASCQNNNAEITEIDISGGTAPYLYEWLDEQGNRMATTLELNNLAAGSYTFQVSDANNCQVEQTFEIEQAIAPIIADFETIPSTCGAANGQIHQVLIEAGTPPFFFEWKDSQGNIISTNPSIDQLKADVYTLLISDQNDCIVERSITVEAIEKPQIELASIIENPCENEANGMLGDITITGGQAPFNYLWQDATGAEIGYSADISNLATGDYTLIIQDALGCEASKRFSLSAIDMAFVITPIINQPTCGAANGNIQLEIEGFTSTDWRYIWSDADETILAEGFLGDGFLAWDNLKAGTYSIQITDGKCEKTMDITLMPATNVLNDLTFTSQPTTCGAANGSVHILDPNSIINEAYTIIWEAEQGNELRQNVIQQNDLAAGNYTITIKDEHDCSIQKTITIDASQELEVMLVNTTSTTCHLAEAEATVSVQGGHPPYAYNWGNIATENDSVMSGLAVGTYQVQIKDGAGCTDRLEFTIEGALETIAPYCQTASDAHLSIAWEAIEGANHYRLILNDAIEDTIIINENEYTLNNLPPDSLVQFHIQAISDHPLCASSNWQTIECQTEPLRCTEVVLEWENMPTNICQDAAILSLNCLPEGGIFTIEGNEYSRFNPAQFSLGSHQIHYLYIDELGCPHESSHSITIHPQVQANFKIVGEPCTAEDMTFTYGGVNRADNQYHWLLQNNQGEIFENHEQQQFTTSFQEAGQYRIGLAVFNDYCSDTLWQSIKISAVEWIIAPNDTAINAGNTINFNVLAHSLLDLPVVYHWLDEDNQAIDLPITPTKESNYQVLVVDEQGCIVEDWINVRLIYPNEYQIPTAFSPNRDGINDDFTIIGHNIQQMSMWIYNRWGEQIFQKHNDNGRVHWNGLKDGWPLPIGTYVYHIQVVFEDGSISHQQGNVLLTR